MKDQIKTVGLIGCGSVASQWYKDILKSYFSASLKFFYDIDPGAALSLAKLCDGESTSLQELIDKSDFIIITTPPDSHYELLLKSIKKGKLVFCEKPFLLSKSNVEEIIALQNSQNATVYAGYVRRFFTAPNLAKDFIKKSLLGEITKVEIFEGGRFTWNSNSGYHINNKYGGVLLDTGSHSIDTLLYVLGLDTIPLNFSLLSRQRIPGAEPSHVFKANFTIGHRQNIEGSIFLSRRTSLANKINIYGEMGMMEVPLDLKSMVKITTPYGKSILREKYPIISIDQAFSSQFQHILNESGELLKATCFLNTVALCETLITDSL